MKIQSEIYTIINAPDTLVWNIIIDTYLWPQWGPSVRDVRCQDRYIHSQSAGYVQTVFGLWFPFQVTYFVSGFRWDWRVGSIQATSHRVEPISKKQCKLIFGVPVVAKPYGLICKIAANRIKRIVEGESNH